LVEQFVLIFFDQKLASLAFVVDDHGNHIANLIDEFLFRFAECDLVADLVEIAK
jgi:hypothetical protein